MSILIYQDTENHLYNIIYIFSVLSFIALLLFLMRKSLRDALDVIKGKKRIKDLDLEDSENTKTYSGIIMIITIGLTMIYLLILEILIIIE